MKRQGFLVALIILFVNYNSVAQNTRLNTYNTIGWYNYFGSFKLNSKFSIHSEYQCRRTNWITNWQQSLLRLGLNYHVTKDIVVRAGYAWIETYPYGEYALNALGRDFTEHRIFEMVQLNNKYGPVEVSNRFILEQRFLGRYSSASVTNEDEYPLLNRIRYMVRLQVPIKGNEIKDKTPYLAFYDELFIGFGKNVTTNVFDQNRLSALIGYRLSKNFRIETGYLYQLVQYGRLINGQNAFQYNNGIILNAYFNFDLSKKKQEL